MNAHLRHQAVSGDNAVQFGLRALQDRSEREALPLLKAAAAGPGRSSAVLHVLGLLHRALGDLGPALSAFDDALAITPGSAKLTHARARAALEAGVRSVEWFDRARVLAPSDGDVILGLAAALLADQAPQDADVLLAGTLRQNPGWLPGHAAIARLRFANGRRGDFIAELDQAIATAPLDARLWHMKIMALHRAVLPDRMMEALSMARRSLGNVAMLNGSDAIAATEYGTAATADAAFALVDPFSESDLLVHWLRHSLRRKMPEHVIGSADRIAPAMRTAALPYMSIARRLLGQEDNLPADNPVRIVDFGENWPPLASLIETLRSLHRTTDAPLDQSVRGGTQTDGPLLSRIAAPIVALRARLEQEVDAYRALPALSVGKASGREPVPASPRFTGSWSVRLNRGGFHEPHVHPEGWLSSAFYVAVPTPGELPRAGWLELDKPPASLGLDLPATQDVEPRPGRLVLFPSTTWHSTRPFGAGERLTVAFDVA